MTLWMRQRYPKDSKYHLPIKGNECNQDWHYFLTLCHWELKGLYGQWDIKDNPNRKECCKDCLKIIENEP